MVSLQLGGNKKNSFYLSFLFYYSVVFIVFLFYLLSAGSVSQGLLLKYLFSP